MNFIRLIGDMLHLFSIVILLVRMKGQRSCSGISLRTQEMYFIVFVTRYLDVFTHFVSIYNTFMKFAYIGLTAWTIFMIRMTYKVTYNKDADTFRHIFLVVPAYILPFIWSEDGWFAGFENLVDTVWAGSEYLEVVAILPQLYMLQRTEDVNVINVHYIAALGGYRAFYVMNWIYRYMTEWGYWMPMTWFCGTVQTLLYLDFFYYYFKSVQTGEKFQLPVA